MTVAELEQTIKKREYLDMTTRGLLEEIYKLEESQDIKAKEYAFEVQELNHLAI